MEKTSTGLEANVAGLLCYVLGWISGLVFILIEKENTDIRTFYGRINSYHQMNTSFAQIINFVGLLGPTTLHI